MKVKSSYIWAAVIALGVAGWMMSGSFMSGGAPDAVDSSMTEAVQAKAGSATDVQASAPSQTTPRISAVMVENSAVRRSVRASGVIQPKSVVTISSESNGRVRKVPAREGSPVSAGDTLVILATDTLPARIRAAKAEIAAAETSLQISEQQARGTYEEERAAAIANLDVARQRLEISQKLATQNFSAPVELAQLKANFENARMTLAQIELAQNSRSEVEISQNRSRLESARSNLAVLQDQLAKSTIKVPASGWLETVHVDVGEQMTPGTVAATILEMDEMKVIVAVPQTSITQITVGDPVSVDVAGMGRQAGKVSKIASITSSATRTFDVEILVPNAERKLRAGMTVEASIDVGFQPAFGMSPAHLSVAGDGTLTAKIDDGGTVRVVPVELVRSGVEQVFVAGLSDGDVLLTFGQAFVEAGDDVRVSMESSS